MYEGFRPNIQFVGTPGAHANIYEGNLSDTYSCYDRLLDQSYCGIATSIIHPHPFRLVILWDNDVRALICLTSRIISLECCRGSLISLA